MIVYNENTGEIIAKIPDNQNMLTYFFHYPKEFKDSLANVKIDNPPRKLKDYKIVNGKLVRKSEEEINPPIKQKTQSKEQLRITELEKEVEALKNILLER